MDRSKSRILTDWLSSLPNRYNNFIKESQKNRCKIVGIETDEETKEAVLLVLISGVKKQVISYMPKELITNDSMLSEFSSSDVRAITFYALQHANFASRRPAIYIIAGEEFCDGKTTYLIKKFNENGEIRKSAYELYCNNELLSQFNYNDLKNIISTAIQEQTMNDFRKIHE